MDFRNKKGVENPKKQSVISTDILLQLQIWHQDKLEGSAGAIEDGLRLSLQTPLPAVEGGFVASQVSKPRFGGRQRIPRIPATNLWKRLNLEVTFSLGDLARYLRISRVAFAIDPPVHRSS